MCVLGMLICVSMFGYDVDGGGVIVIRVWLGVYV